MATPWDARTCDRSSRPQQAWASEVLARLAGIAPDATVMDVGCGTGRVTEALLAIVPRGRVLAMDASDDMVQLARQRLGDRAEVWCQDVLELELDEPVDAIISTATLHWVTDHDRLWRRLARALRPGGVRETQCGGQGNIARVRRSSRRSLATAPRSLQAGRRGSLQGRRRPKDACAMLAVPRSGAGCRSVRPIRRTSALLCRRRSSSRTSPVCPSTLASGSLRRSWPA
jgi:SAM-dependent methyltransferase